VPEFSISWLEAWPCELAGLALDPFSRLISFGSDVTCGCQPNEQPVSSSRGFPRTRLEHYANCFDPVVSNSTVSISLDIRIFPDLGVGLGSPLPRRVAITLTVGRDFQFGVPDRHPYTPRTSAGARVCFVSHS
jgi:hypothetical protein